MHFVYILQSNKDKRIYIGYTSNLEKRIEMHNNGMSDYTSKYMPWELVYFEAYRSKEDALHREKTLKLHAQGLRRLKERLRNSLA